MDDAIAIEQDVLPAAEDSEIIRTIPASVTVVPALALAACGSGGGGGSGSSAPPPTGGTPPPPPVATISAAQASRFLAQASMGATKAGISQVQSQGYDAYLTAQFNTARATTFWDILVAGGYNANTSDNVNGTPGFEAAVWRTLITGQDQLRQRVGSALLETLVVGIGGIMGNSWQSFQMAAYMDILWDNAFGNFRTILDKISTNVAMGTFLTFINNRKANASTGSVPDENYARELMQLFTIGLYQLNLDGTQKTTGGKPIETYTQADVSQLARVFTGWRLDGPDNTTPDRMRRPMVQNASAHETGAKAFLGATVPAGTDGVASLKIALDTIFAHANVAPFISKQLIQRLVTSNPSPAYVRRVATVFENNGSGTRGDLKAVVRAILLDSEARDDAAAASSTTAGKLREPIVRLTNWARAFNANSPSNAWPIGDTSSSNNRLAQSTGRSASVFNFFRPGYAPPNTAISSGSLVAPEFQITNELSVVAYINYMRALIEGGMGDFKADYTDILTKASDSQALVDEVNLVLAAGQLSAATVTTIKGAVESVATTASNAANNRVYIAVLLTMASPEYITLK